MISQGMQWQIWGLGSMKGQKFHYIDSDVSNLGGCQLSLLALLAHVPLGILKQTA